MKKICVIWIAILIIGVVAQEMAISQSSDDRTVTLNTTVSKRFVVEQLGDVSCTFTVEIDPSREDDPVIRQETLCNNLLQFISNTDIEVTITKQDATPGDTRPGELAVLDALGVKIDRTTTPSQSNNFFGTGCVFLDSAGLEESVSDGLNKVLINETDDIWYDPQVDGDVVAGDGNFFNSQTITLNLPVEVTGIYDCRFKLEFFLSTDDFRLLPGGQFQFIMAFTSAATSGFEGF